MNIDRIQARVPKQGFACSVGKADGSGTSAVNAIGQFVGLSSGDIGMLNYLYANAPAARPIADAGADQRHTGRGVNVQLDGSASMAMPGATIVKYEWKPLGWTRCYPAWECPNPVVNSGNARASVYLERNGERWDPPTIAKYQLVVTDNLGRTMSDVVTVTLAQ